MSSSLSPSIAPASANGFNQAELIARATARRLGLPFKPVLLMRTKARPDKHILSNEERWRIVRGAFATRPGSQVDNKRVLLLDDVMTTGATLDACAERFTRSWSQVRGWADSSRAVRSQSGVRRRMSIGVVSVALRERDERTTVPSCRFPGAPNPRSSRRRCARLRLGESCRQ